MLAIAFEASFRSISRRSGRRQDAVGVQVRDEDRQIVGVEDFVDRGQVGADWRQARGLDPRLVHARGVEVRGLLAIAAAAGRFEDAAQQREVAILHLLEPAERSAIGRDRVFRDPAAAGELVEVRAGIHLAIQRVDLYAGGSGRPASARFALRRASP